MKRRPADRRIGSRMQAVLVFALRRSEPAGAGGAADVSATTAAETGALSAAGLDTAGETGIAIGRRGACPLAASRCVRPAVPTPDAIARQACSDWPASWAGRHGTWRL